MNSKNEQKIVLLIRYTLPIFIITLSLIITTLLYFENTSAFEKLRVSTQDRFISDKKLIIKEQIENIASYIISEQKNTEESLRKRLKHRVHQVHQAITNMYAQLKNEKSKEEMIPIIRSFIKDIRFNNTRGYFFINDFKGHNIIHPVFPYLEGQNLLNPLKEKNNDVLEKSIRLLQEKDESYLEWHWQKSASDPKEYKKIGFIKTIKELDWFIGTGEYLPDFSQDIQHNILQQIQKFKFGQNGYIFIIDENNRFLHHIIQDRIGKNAFNADYVGNLMKLTQDLHEAIAQGGGYISYTQKFKALNKPHRKKTTYIKKIPHWNWIIGTGFYEDDVQAIVSQQQKILETRYNTNLKNIFIISLIMTITLVIFSFYISYVIERKFKEYKQNIDRYITKNKRQYELLAQKSKLAAMGEMMENIAHQWRQPLSVITIAASGIRVHKDLNSLNDDLLEDALSNISMSANHLSETIDDFRDFFKTDKEKGEFNIHTAIEKSLKLLSSQFQSHEINVINKAEHHTIIGFERDLLQVFLNVFNNAKDALEQCESERYIFVDAFAKKEQLFITVKDNAGGIDEDIIDRIFEPYFTTKHQSIGTGIGLYMSQEIINRHMNGSITIENTFFTYKSKEYKGALFTIMLPL
jgi:signal transduction histidine kinase